MRFSPTKTPMPWSTCTTRSPTLRSRKSDRKVRVAERRRSWTLRSSSKTSVSAQSCSAASGSRNPRERWPVPTRTPVRCGVLGALDRHREDVVVGEELDGALGAARRVRDEHDGVAALAAAADLGRPSPEPGRRTPSPAGRTRDGLTRVRPDPRQSRGSRARSRLPATLPLRPIRRSAPRGGALRLPLPIAS